MACLLELQPHHELLRLLQCIAYRCADAGSAPCGRRQAVRVAAVPRTPSRARPTSLRAHHVARSQPAACSRNRSLRCNREPVGGLPVRCAQCTQCSHKNRMPYAARASDSAPWPPPAPPPACACPGEAETRFLRKGRARRHLRLFCVLSKLRNLCHQRAHLQAILRAWAHRDTDGFAVRE